MFNCRHARSKRQPQVQGSYLLHYFRTFFCALCYGVFSLCYSVLGEGICGTNAYSRKSKRKSRPPTSTFLLPRFCRYSMRCAKTRAYSSQTLRRPSQIARQLRTHRQNRTIIGEKICAQIRRDGGRLVNAKFFKTRPYYDGSKKYKFSSANFLRLLASENPSIRLADPRRCKIAAGL